MSQGSKLNHKIRDLLCLEENHLKVKIQVKVMTIYQLKLIIKKHPNIQYTIKILQNSNFWECINKKRWEKKNKGNLQLQLLSQLMYCI